MCKITILLLVLFSSIEIYSQSVEVVIEEIANTNELHGQYLGIAGTPSDQYERYARLKKELSNDQLVELTNHSNAVVRCYSFWALTDRKEDDLFEILVNRIDDTATVYKQFADVVDHTTVADFCIDLLTRDFIFTADYYRENNSQLTLEEKEVLDSLVIFSSTNLRYLNRILDNYEPDPKLYSQVRDLAALGNLHAFPALARHQNEEDIDLILSLDKVKRGTNMYPHPLEKLFQSIEEFPDAKFLDYLNEFGEEISDQRGWSHTWIYFYRAVATYKSKAALAILSRPYQLDKPISRYHLRFINNALGKYPDPIYEDLIIKIWREYKQITEGSFNYLKRQNDSLTFSLIIDYLEDFEEVYSGANEQEMLPIIIPFALEYNQEQTIELIANNLRTNTITPFQEFYPFVIELKSSKFIEPLFERIEKEWNGHVFYLAVEMIGSFEDKELNEQVISRSKRNKKVINKYTTRKELEDTIRRILKGNSYYEAIFKGG